jgi:hypothetical protein
VVEGTLERSLTEYAMGSASNTSELANSTSLVFERARAEGVRTLVLPRGASTLPIAVSDDSGARVREDLTSSIVVAPERQILLAQMPRFAWWRIDPRSGKTIAVTDEGLYQSAGEYTFEENEDTHRVRIGERAYLGGRWVTVKPIAEVGPRAALAFVDACLREGATLAEILESGSV